MIPQVQVALDKIVGGLPTLRFAKGAGRIFELYVMTGIALSLKNAGYEVWLERSDETRIHPHDTDRRFIQRGGAPSGIPSKYAGAKNGSYIVFRAAPGSAMWEIWNGIQFQGRSGGNHEIDIAIVPRSTGRELRQSPSGGRPTGRPRVAIECKDVGAPGSIDEMRAFIARLYDLTLLDGHRTYMGISPYRAINPGNPSNCDHDPAKTYWQENERTYNAIARRSGFVTGASALTSYHFVRPHRDIKTSTSNPTALFDAVTDWCVTRGY